MQILSLAVRTSPSISFYLFTHLFNGTGPPPPQPPTLPPPCPLPASLPCFLAGHTTCGAPFLLTVVLPQAQALCTRLGRKGKLTRKWLATPRFAKMRMCVSVGVSVSTVRHVCPPLLKHLMMLPHPSISHSPPALWGGVDNNLNIGP